MKKSKCYRLAQVAVLGESSLTKDEKLEILRVLMEEERVQEICEKVATEKAEQKNESEVDPY